MLEVLSNPWVLGLIATAAVALVIYSVIPKKTASGEAIDRRLGSDDRGGGVKAADLAALRRKTAPNFLDVVKKAAPRIAAPLGEEQQSALRSKLAMAGVRSEGAPMVFMASKTIMGLVVLVVVLVATWKAGHPLSNVLGLTAGLGALSFMLPNVWLSLITSERQKKIKKGLADALDMMVIMVEAGLGLDAGIQRVGQEMAEAYPELAEEFRIANAEMNMGLNRSQALQNLADRIGLNEMRSLASVIIQAERFGSSVGKTLRIQSDTLRVKRQQAAEEAAQKTAVKLLIPLVLFIFPALMIVVGGPAVMGLMQSFARMKQ